MQMSEKDEEARKVAETHYAVDTGITQIFRITGGADAETRPNEPIKLLEVNECTIPSGVMPLRFAPTPARGIHFPLVIVEITPDEFEKMQARHLALPDGWTLGELLPRPAGAPG